MIKNENQNLTETRGAKLNYKSQDEKEFNLEEPPGLNCEQGCPQSCRAGITVEFEDARFRYIFATASMLMNSTSLKPNCTAALDLHQ